MRAISLHKPEPTEAQVLSAVLHALTLHPAVGQAWRVNSGAGQLVRRKGGASQFLRFGFPGCPDIHGYLKDGRALYCEVKRPSGKVTPEQSAFIQTAGKAGCVAFIARGAEDVMQALAAAQTTSNLQVAGRDSREIVKQGGEQ